MVISSALHISVQTRYHMPYGNILSEFFFLIFPVCRWRQMFPCQRLGNCGMTEKMWRGGCLGLHLWRLFVCWFQLCFVWRAFGNQIMLLISKLPIGRTDEGKSSQTVWELFFPFLAVVMCIFLSSECVHCADFFLECANWLILDDLHGRMLELTCAFGRMSRFWKISLRCQSGHYGTRLLVKSSNSLGSQET